MCKRTVAEREVHHAVRAEEHGAEVVDAEGLSEGEDVLLRGVGHVGVVGGLELRHDRDVVRVAGAVNARGPQTAATGVTVAVAGDGVAGPGRPRRVVHKEATVILFDE